MSKPPEKAKRPRSLARRILRAAAEVVGIVVVIIVIASMSGCCERLFYYPDARVYSTPAESGLAFEPVEFTSKDGTRLTGWFIPAVGEAKGTIVHCHGNAQNMTSHWLFAEFLPRKQFNLFVFDYRGYGKSEGSVGRAGTVEDAQAALDYVFGRADVDAERVALFGQSLGGAIATVVAAQDKRVKALFIDSAFSSYQSEAAHVLRGNPLTYLFSWPLSRMLIRPGYDPIDHIASVSPRPVLIIHGTEDPVVPHEMSRELHEAAGEPKEVWIVDGAGHTAAGSVRRAEYQQKVCEFFEKAFGEK